LQYRDRLGEFVGAVVVEWGFTGLPFGTARVGSDDPHGHGLSMVTD
jgi:hypothetical protein